MNLLYVAPGIQEAILILPRLQNCRDPVHLDRLQGLASILDLRTQHCRWNEMLAKVR